MSSTERARLVREVAAMRARNELRLAQVRESFLQATILWDQTVAANEAAKKDAETAQEQVSAGQGAFHRPPAAVSAPPVPPPPVVAVASGDCQALLARYFGDDLAWAQRVAQRESGCTAGAVNQREGCDTSGRTNSHAMGVFQMCYPMHEPTFAAVGCAGQPLDLECNIKAARALYNGSGRGPWGG